MGRAAAIFRMVVRAGFRAPASILGLVGLLVLGALLSLPGLASYAANWPVVALIVVGGWFAMAATQLQPDDFRRLRLDMVRGDPYLMQAVERRNALAAQLDFLTIASVRTEVEAMLRRIDTHLLPELANRLQRHRVLLQALRQHERGRGPLVGANPEKIDALRRLARDQAQVFDGFVARLSNMNANLLGLTQEADQERFVSQTHEWEQELGAYWQATAEVFRSGDLELEASGRRTAARRVSR